MKKSVALGLVLGSGFFAGTVWAGSVNLPNSFTAGTPALAAEVNGNFAAVKSAVDDNHARITSAEGTIANHSDALTTNSNAHASMTTAIDGNSARLTTAEGTIASHAWTIAMYNEIHGTLQTRVSGSCLSGNSIRVINADGTVVCQADANSGGDITGVIAGSGLAVSGATGDVTISIPTGAITANHLALGAVGSTDILDGTIVSADIADGTVASADILDGTILSADIADNTIVSADIADNTVTAADIIDESGVAFAAASSWGPTTMSTCGTTVTLDSISVVAPTSGYIYVSASGFFCTPTAGVNSYLALDDTPGHAGQTYDANNYAYDGSAVTRTCAVGPGGTPYSFQNVYTVAGPGTYTYYVNGCVSSAGNQTYFVRRPMVAMFFPTRY